MIDLYIGIDPGEANGVAIYDKVDGLRLYTLSFWKLIDYIQNKVIPAYKVEKKYIPHFVVENPALNTFIYHQKVNGKNAKEALRIARNVGMNQQDAKRLIEFLNRHDLIVDEFQPIKSSQKWTASYFNMISKQNIQTNQHVRDAAKLIAKHWVK